MMSAIKNKVLKLFVLFLAAGVFLGFEEARAGLLIEPYLGYLPSTSTSSERTAAYGGATYSGKEDGYGIGARLGYSFIIPFVALDYSIKTLKYKADSGGTDTDDTATEMALVVGANLPIVRVFAGYGFDFNLKQKSDSSTTTLKGTFTKVGVGFKVIPMVAVNLEYFMYSPSKIDTGSGEYTFSDVVSTLKYNPIFLSISIPL